MKGCNNKLLLVDLSTGEISTRILGDEILKKFPGGEALGARMLYELMPKNTDAFAEESVLGFVPGYLNGSGAFMSCRCTVVHKSPVTGGFNDASTGGTFGPDLKKAGFDGIFVKGKASKPVYLFIDDGAVEIRDASKYWGRTTTTELEKELKEEIGKSVTVASCGRGGENKAFTAAIMNNGHRAAARGGPGAVMGSKNLKAVVVTGGKYPEVFDKDRIIAINKEVAEWQKNGPVKPTVDAFKEWGTGCEYDSQVMMGDGGTKNWGGAGADMNEQDLQNVWAVQMDKKYKVKKYACFACPVGCGALYRINEQEMGEELVGRPEYETAGSFGSLLMNGDAYTVNYCNTLCNEYGLDTISAGATIAWAMECFENKLLSKEDLDGIELTWGNAEAIRQITKKMCLGEGVGKILANGSVYSIKHFGKGEEFRNDAGGIELPQHDPRNGPSLARTYKFDPTPGRHVKGGVGSIVGNRELEYKMNPDAFLPDDVLGTKTVEAKAALGCCEFTGFGYTPNATVDYLNAASGLDFTEEDFLNIGQRSFLLRQMFNLREGLTRKDTFLAPRLMGQPPMDRGPHKGISYDVEVMGDNFYKAFGCDIEGVPYKETLEALGGLEFTYTD